MKKNPAAFLIGGLMLALTTHGAMAFDQAQLDILESGVPAWNAWIEANPDAKVDLSGADLTSQGLTSQGLT